MLNAIIIEKDISFSKDIANSIMQNNLDIRLHAIVSTPQEAIKVLKNFNIDIIVLDLDTNGKTDEFLKYVYQEKYKKYKNSIFLIANENIDGVSKMNSPFVYDFIKKPFEKKEFLNKLNKLVMLKKREGEEDFIQQKIKTELTYLKYNFSYYGTRYLCDTIWTLFQRENYYKDDLKNDIYPIIAEKYGKTVNNIKCNILSATNNMFYECESEKIQKYFYTTQKPKPKMVIYTILNRL